MDSKPVDYSSHVEHHQMIMTIYRFLTNETVCPQIGSHWQTIGFQGTDPRTDIRGCGMLGVLQVLHFQYNKPKTFKMIYQHSIQKESEFPLIIQLFSFTSLCLGQVRSGKLYPMCNSLNSVFKAVNIVYECLVVMFMSQYMIGKCSIVDIDRLSKTMKKDILTKGIAKMISLYKSKSDEEFIEILSSGGIVEASQDVVSTDSPVKAAKKKSR